MSHAERMGVAAIVAIGALAGVVAGLVAATVAEDSRSGTWLVRDTALLLLIGGVLFAFLALPFAVREGRRWARKRDSL